MLKMRVRLEESGLRINITFYLHFQFHKLKWINQRTGSFYSQRNAPEKIRPDQEEPQKAFVKTYPFNIVALVCFLILSYRMLISNKYAVWWQYTVLFTWFTFGCFSALKSGVGSFLTRVYQKLESLQEMSSTFSWCVWAVHSKYGKYGCEPVTSFPCVTQVFTSQMKGPLTALCKLSSHSFK